MSQQTVLTVTFLPELLQVHQEMGDKEYLSKKQFDGKLFKEISAEFSGNGVQISHIVPSGKTFYLVGAKLYPVTNTVPPLYLVNTDTLTNRRADVELEFDGTLIDVLTHDFQAFMGDTGGSGPGAAAMAAQYDSLIVDSFDGDGIKVISLTSTSTTGTYRVSLIGFEEDTGTDPTILASSITVDATVAGETGDIPFIQGKVLASNYFQVSGDINALNDTIEFIVPDLKTAFLLEAKITMNANPSSTPADGGATQTIIDQIVADLKIDTAIKSKAKIGMHEGSIIPGGEGAGVGMGVASESKFNVLGLSLQGDGVKKIEIENVLDNGSAFAEMSGYLIDT